MGRLADALARVLGFALETFGSQRIVVGSDYPFKLGVDDPVGELEPLGLDAAPHRRLTTDNAREFLALKSLRQREPSMGGELQ